MESRIRRLVEALCSDECAGRAPGTAGSRAARELLKQALADALGGADLVREQPVPASEGTNLYALLPGETDRWVLVSAHYDHLGQSGRTIYRGADDNAAAVAALIEAARLLSGRKHRRGILFALFDAEEPPYFLSQAMGSEHFAQHAPVPLPKLDLMICMDLVGHALGPEFAPPDIRKLVFALGAERSEGTAARVDALANAESAISIRRLDATLVPPLSDYWAFWERRVPFVFLTCGRSRAYHTPDDTPETLSFEKIAGVARWLSRFTDDAANRPEPQVSFTDAGDDLSTARTLEYVAHALSPQLPEAEQAAALAGRIATLCDGNRRAPEELALQLRMLVGLLESALG